MRLRFFDNQGSLLSNVDIFNESGAIPFDWTEITGTATPPTGSETVRITLWFYQASGWVAFDDVSLTQQGIDNLAPDPGFENGTGWTAKPNSAWPGTTVERGGTGIGEAHAGNYSFYITNQANGSLSSERIPVTGNQDYDVAFDLRGEIDADDSLLGAKVQVTFYGAIGAVLQTYDIIDHTTTPNTNWERTSDTITAPNRATEAEISCWLEHAIGWIAVDEVWFSETGSSTNLLADPGFENGTSWTENSIWPGTSIWRGSLGTSEPSAGSYAFSISNHAYGNVESDPVSVQPNTTYDLSTWARGELDTDDGFAGVEMRVGFYDDGDVLIQGLAVYTDDQGTALTESWAQITGRFVTPPNCASVRVQLRSVQSSGWIAYDDVELVEVAPEIFFETSTYTVSEAGGQVTATVILSAATNSTVTVDFATVDDTAEAGSDYEATAGQLSWPPGDTTPQTISVTINADGLEEGVESFFLNLVKPENAPITEPSSALVYVNDYDYPTVQFTQLGFAANEAVGTMTATVEISKPPAIPVSVDFSTASDTATAGDDFIERADSIDWQIGDDTPKPIVIQLIDDGDLDFGESFVLTLDQAERAVIGHRFRVPMIIYDDESAGSQGWRFEAQGSVEGVGYESAFVPFRQDFDPLQQGLDPPLVFATHRYNVFAGSLGHSVRVSDVSTLGFEVAVIPAVHPSPVKSKFPLCAPFTCTFSIEYIAIEAGTHFLPDGTRIETGVLSTEVSQPDGGWETAEFATDFASAPAILAQVQTTNNHFDTDYPVWLTAALHDLSETEVKLALERSEVSFGFITETEDLAYLALDAGDGTIPTPDPSYTTVFNAGLSPSEVDHICSDAGELLFDPSLPSAFALASLASRNDGDGGWARLCYYDSWGSVSVQEDRFDDSETDHLVPERASRVFFERPVVSVIPVPTVSFTSTTATVIEGSGGTANTVTFDVHLEDPPETDITIEFAVVPDTADAADYENVLPDSYELTWPPGDGEDKTITIDIVPDSIFEGNEAFTVELAGAPPGTVIGDGVAGVTILDDDDAPTVTFASATYTVDEDPTNNTTDIEVTLTGLSSSVASVNVVFTDVTATAGQDYEVLTPTVIYWQPGETGSQAIQISSSHDVLYEGNETVDLALGSLSGCEPDSQGFQDAVLTILDDDPEPGVVVTADEPCETTEGGQQCTFTVDLISAPTSPVTIPVASDNEDEGVVDASTVTFATGEYNSLKTITITGVDDQVDDGNQPFTIVLGAAQSSDQNYSDFPVDDVEVTNIDDDTAGVVVNPPGNPTTTEDPTALNHTTSFTVVLTSEPTHTVTIGVQSSNTSEGTVSVADVSFDAGNWQDQQTIVVTGEDDSDIDGDQGYTIVLDAPASSDPNYSNIDLTDVSLTNIDDDVEPTVSFSFTTFSGGEESGVALVSVTLSGTSTSAVSVDLAVIGGTADVIDDFILPAEMGFNWADGEAGTRTVTLTIIDDDLAEGPETVELRLEDVQPPGSCTIVAPLNVTLTIEDNDQAGVIIQATTAPETNENSDAANNSAQFEVKLNTMPIDTVRVNFQSSDLTEGRFDPNPNFLEFAPGEWDISKTLIVNGWDDGEFDGDTTYYITSSCSAQGDPNYHGLVGPAHDLTNKDDEIRITIEQPDPVGEDVGTIAVSVFREGPTDEELSISFVLGGTATEGMGADYSTSSPVSFAPGSQDTTIDIAIRDDDEPEPSESIDILLMMDEDDHIVLGTPAQTTVMIDDNEDTPYPVIGEPTGRRFGEGDELNVDATASTVPPAVPPDQGWEAKLAIVKDESGSLSLAKPITSSLIDQFTTEASVDGYRIRLVIARAQAMPEDPEFLYSDSPCVFSSDPSNCHDTEALIENANGRYYYPFTASYVTSDAVLLTWTRTSCWPDDDMVIEYSEDGGQNWQLLAYPHQDWQPSGYNGWAHRSVRPGRTYHYRASGSCSSHQWLYLGTNLTSPGDPVVTDPPTLPRPIPNFGAVTWDCPSEATRFFQCEGTLSVEITPEPGESLIGYNLEVYVNEPTFEATAGNGDPLRIRWPQYRNFSGRDEPKCVEPHPGDPQYLKFNEPITSDSMTIEVPGVHYGANGFRFVVSNTAGTVKSERALLFGVHDEDGNHFFDQDEPEPGSHDQLLPTLFGTDVSDEDYDLRGIGPVSMRSPDCADGDGRDEGTITLVGVDAIYAARIFWDGPQVQTDANGYWGRNDPNNVWPPEGNYTMQPIIFNGDWCDPWVAGIIGRSILAEDRTSLTGDEETRSRFVCPPHPNYDLIPSFVLTSVSLPTHEPELSFHPGSVFSTSQDPITAAPFRFRITDTGQDVNLDQVTVENLDYPGAVKAYYMADQSDHSPDQDVGDWGWFVAEVPMGCPTEDCVNHLQIEVSDLVGNTLDPPSSGLVDVTLDRPSVWAERNIFGGDEQVVEPTQIITVDASDSVAPGLGAPDGAVAKWVFFRYEPGQDPEFLEESLFLSSQEDLVLDYRIPHHTYSDNQWLHRIKGRLVIAEDMYRFSQITDLHEFTMSNCTWDSGGDCDHSEFDFLIAGLDVYPPYLQCLNSPYDFSADLSLSGSPPSAAAPDEEVTFHVEVNNGNFCSGGCAFRWLVYGFDDPDWPLFIIGDGEDDDHWAESNDLYTFTPNGAGIPFGEYWIRAEVRDPPSGCYDPVTSQFHEWDYAITAPHQFAVKWTIDGVAPGQVVETATGVEPFRVWSRTLPEGDAYVFFDDAQPWDNALVFPGTVQPGGFIKIDPVPPELTAIGQAWFVSVNSQDSMIGRSTWVNALDILTSGDASFPHVVANDEDVSCGGIGTECAHPILPGQYWKGEWGEAGDEDGFIFLAGAGTGVTITLERVNLDLPPQHPDAPAPEIYLAGPDGVVFAASDPLPLDATGTTLSATLTVDGEQTIVVRTSKGTGEYLMSLNVTAEAGTGAPTFGFTPELTFLTTAARKDAQLKVPLLDAFGNPTTGTNVFWEQGMDCGAGAFCGTGTTRTLRSSREGFALLNVTTSQGGDPLWKPSTELAPLLKSRPIERPGVAERIARARAERPVLGTIRMSNRALTGTNLVDPTTAQTLKAEAQRRALASGRSLLKDGDHCDNHQEACPNDGEPVFHAAQLDLNLLNDPDDEVVDVAVRILENGLPIERLDDDSYTILDSITLDLEIEVTVSPTGGGDDYPLYPSGPAAVVLSEGTGGALFDGVNTCGTLELDAGAGGFTYLNSSRASMHYTEDDNGLPCCWQPTEIIQASVVFAKEIDDGHGGVREIAKRASTIVESVPRPDDPCEIRPWPPGFAGETPQIAGVGAHPLPAGETSTWEWVADVYTTDACGNLHYLAADDPPITASPPYIGSDPSVWAEAVQSEAPWQWHVLLRSTYCLPDPFDCNTGDKYEVPDEDYNVVLSHPSASACGGAYTQPIHLDAHLPVVRLTWGLYGDEPILPIASPGSALRNPETGSFITWRIVPTDSNLIPPPGVPTEYSNVLVNLYVGKRSVRMDWDGNVVESFPKVDDVEICVGELLWSYDVGINERRATCDTIYTGEAVEIPTYFNPNILNQSPFVDMPIGVAVGLTKVPDEPGNYVLIAEPHPDEEAFRRGDSWQIATDVIITVGEDSSHRGTYRKDFVVGGGMFLDEEYSPVDPFIVSEPIPAYLMVYEQVVRSLPPTALLSTFDQDGELVASGIQVPLVQASGGSDYYAELQLQPDGFVVSAKGGKSGETKSGGIPVNIGFGLGRIEATVDDIVIPNGTVFPGLLGLRFLTRSDDGDCSTSGYTPGIPEGAEQQTSISNKESNFAETVCVEIRAMHPDDPDRVFKTDAEVGLIELPNDRYTVDTRRFYDGTHGSTLLDLSGSIDETNYSLEDGVLKVALHSSAKTRKEPGTGGDIEVLPPYSGVDGAAVVPVPIDSSDPLSPVSGGQYHISHWVDERGYSRVRGGASGQWTGDGSPNQIRDWLEKMVWDTLATFEDDGTGEVENACSAVSTITESFDKELKGWVDWSQPDNIFFNPTGTNMRFRLEPGEHIERPYFSLKETLGEDEPATIVIHEARHVWQLHLPEINPNVYDSDDDRVFWEGSIGDAPLDLIDSPNVAAGGHNPDGHYFGDAIGSEDQAAFVVSVFERNAMRFTSRLGLTSDLTCHVGTVSPLTALELSGSPGTQLSPSLALEVIRSDAPWPADGITVEFAVCDSDPSDGCGTCDALVRSPLQDEWRSQDWYMTTGVIFDSGVARCQVMVGTIECTVVATALQLMAPQDNCDFAGSPLTFRIIPE